MSIAVANHGDICPSAKVEIGCKFDICAMIIGVDIIHRRYIFFHSPYAEVASIQLLASIKAIFIRDEDICGINCEIKKLIIPMAPRSVVGESSSGAVVIPMGEILLIITRIPHLIVGIERHNISRQSIDDMLHRVSGLSQLFRIPFIKSVIGFCIINEAEIGQFDLNPRSFQGCLIRSCGDIPTIHLIGVIDYTARILEFIILKRTDIIPRGMEPIHKRIGIVCAWINLNHIKARDGHIAVFRSRIIFTVIIGCDIETKSGQFLFCVINRTQFIRIILVGIFQDICP